MRNMVLTGVLAGAMALTAIAPTQAQSRNNLGALIAGAAGVFIIGKAISDAKARENRQSAQAAEAKRLAEIQRQQRLRPLHVAPQRVRQRLTDAGTPRRLRDVPRRCPRQRLDRGRWVTFTDRDCEARVADIRAARQNCLRQRWTRQGWVQFVDDACLARSGINPRILQSN